MNNHQREILALRYLNALENRDLDTLAEILKQAETDAALDGMIREIHAEEQHMPIGVKSPGRASPGMNGRMAVPNHEEKNTMTALTIEKHRIALPWTLAATFAVVLAVGVMLAFWASGSGGPSPDPQHGLALQQTLTSEPEQSEMTVTPVVIKLGDEYSQESILMLPIETDTINLEVEGWVGKVDVIASTEPMGAITVQITRRVKLASESGAPEILDAIKVTAVREGDVYRVSSDFDGDIDQDWIEDLSDIQSLDDLDSLFDSLCCNQFGFPSVDLMITVPQEVNVKVVSEVGEIKVEGIAAPDRVEVETEVGSITVNSVTTPGEMSVKTEVGEIVTDNSTALSSMTLSVETGRIAYDGVIADRGRYQLDVAIGEIDVTVREGSAFQFEAHAEAGDAAVDLEGAQVDYNREIVTMSATGSYNPAQADIQNITLSAHCDMGSIRLHN